MAAERGSRVRAASNQYTYKSIHPAIRFGYVRRHAVVINTRVQEPTRAGSGHGTWRGNFGMLKRGPSYRDLINSKL